MTIASCDGGIHPSNQYVVKLLAIAYLEDSLEIIRIDFQDKSMVSLTNKRVVTPTSFSFENKHSRIIFSAYVEDGKELFLLTPDTKPWQAMTKGGNEYSNPTWSPDGAFIAFNSKSESGNYYVMLIDENGGGLRNLLYGQFANARDPVWSPNGNFVAVLLLDQETNNANGHPLGIGIVDTDSGELEAEILGPAQVFRTLPSWSPDSSRLAYALKKESLDLYVLDLDTGTSKEVALTNLDEWYPIWSPDGSRLVYLRSDEHDKSLSNIILMNTLDWTSEALLQNQLPINSVLWIDNSSLLFSTYNEHEDLTDFNILELDSRELYKLGIREGMYLQLTLMN
jgi:TolB protein